MSSKPVSLLLFPSHSFPNPAIPSILRDFLRDFDLFVTESNCCPRVFVPFSRLLTLLCSFSHSVLLRNGTRDCLTQLGIHPGSPHAHRAVWDDQQDKGVWGPTCGLPWVVYADWDWFSDPYTDGRTPQEAADRREGLD